jgi:hypothetical protein
LVTLDVLFFGAVTVLALPAAAGFLAVAVDFDLVAALALLAGAAGARLRDVVFAMADTPLQTPGFCLLEPDSEARPNRGESTATRVYRQ